MGGEAGQGQKMPMHGLEVRHLWYGQWGAVLCLGSSPDWTAVGTHEHMCRVASGARI